ncbi:PhoH family protein, partial [Planktomarina temperata]|nr:PhoH family protein [Planktomarina temperata]
MAEDAVTAIAAQNESRIEFPNNRLLAELCGEFDRNLTTIETHHAIQIVRRGNLLLLVGDADGAAQASAILQSLYTRLEQGRPVTPADVTAELRMNMVGGDAGRADQQMEMFRSGAVEIKTRKKLVEPRTEAQKAYVEALFKNELSFGIGPAGTGKTYLAVAVGVSMFITGRVDKIILSRPAVEAGERLGFLPGDMKEKVDPYMQPLYDALNDFLPAKQMAKLMEDKAIEIA